MEKAKKSPKMWRAFYILLRPEKFASLSEDRNPIGPKGYLSD